MLKKITLLLASTLIMFASDYTLDTTKSEVYYDAKKEQFFSTHTVIGVNKGLSGSLKKTNGKLYGKLKIDVLKFDSEDSRRDGNVAEHMNAKTHPFVTYNYTITNNRASGMMMVNGVTKKISFPVVIEEKGGKLFVKGNISLKYNDFGMETPGNLILSAHDDLVIGARLYFNK